MRFDSLTVDETQAQPRADSSVKIEQRTDSLCVPAHRRAFLGRLRGAGQPFDDVFAPSNAQGCGKLQQAKGATMATPIMSQDNVTVSPNRGLR